MNLFHGNWIQNSYSIRCFFVATVQVLICFGPGMIAYSSSLLVGTVPVAAVVLALPARFPRWKGQQKPALHNALSSRLFILRGCVCRDFFWYGQVNFLFQSILFRLPRWILGCILLKSRDRLDEPPTELSIHVKHMIWSTYAWWNRRRHHVGFTQTVAFHPYQIQSLRFLSRTSEYVDAN